MMLESLVHEDSSFLTLTYNDEFVPELGSLVPRDTQLFLKRLRQRVGRPVRYFIVGEYGDHTERPHYHAALYGVGLQDKAYVDAAWSIEGEPLGFSYLGSLTVQSAAYIAGYVTKKMTREDDVRLNGRHPEFARMSLKPGLGALSAEQIAAAIEPPEGFSYVEAVGDVPSALSHGGSSLPLGRYMRARIREAVSYDDPGAMSADAARRQKEMQALWLSHYRITGAEGVSNTLRDVIQKESEQKIRNLTSKYKLYKSRKGSGL